MASEVKGLYFSEKRAKKFIAKMVEVKEYDHHQPYDVATRERESEKLNGKDIEERLTNIGAAGRFIREFNNFPKSHPDKQNAFNELISRLGRHILKQTLSSTKEIEDKALEARRRKLKFGKLMRKAVEVYELDDGGVSIRLDKFWDTASWSTDMIETGAECLLSLFGDPTGTSESRDRKERAALMLSKLMERHVEAQEYFRRSIESLVAKTANRSIRGGRVASVLDLLYVIGAAKEKLYVELSRYSYVRKLLEMMLLEMRLAAISMQHLFRSRRNKLMTRSYIPSTEGFGPEEEIEQLRAWAIEIRSLELRAKWASMHWSLSKAQRDTPGGKRGPSFMLPEYVVLCLESIRFLTSVTLKALAIPNREDVVRSCGLIILAGFVSDPAGKFADLTIQVLVNVSKCPEALGGMMHSGVVMACVRYLRHTKKKLRALQSSFDQAPSKGAQVEAGRSLDLCKGQLQSAMLIISRLGTHAAGVFRARGAYRYRRRKLGEDEDDINYLTLLLQSGSALDPQSVQALLGNKHLLITIFDYIFTSSNLNTIRGMLNCLLSLACSECHAPALKEMIAFGARGLFRLVDLLDESDDSVASLSLSTLLQVCTTRPGRDSLVVCKLQERLWAGIASGRSYERPLYLRSVLVASAMARQQQWRAYDPSHVYHALQDMAYVRTAVYLDLLRTVKGPAEDAAEGMTVADLCVVPPSSPELAKDLSYTVGSTRIVTDLCDFLAHPHEDKYFQSLPWDESCAACVIIEAMSTNIDTARDMFSAGTVSFLATAVLLSKFMFTGPPMVERMMVLVLNCVVAASNAVGNFCKTGVGNRRNADIVVAGVRAADLIDSACFFINTLAIDHPSLGEGMKRIQKRVGMSIVMLFDNYCEMLLHVDSSGDNQELHYLKPAGQSVAKLVKVIHNVHGKGDEMLLLLDLLCKKLAKITVPVQIAVEAVVDWGVIECLKPHLPSPLSTVGVALDAHDPLFVRGLGRLPASYLQVCANLSQGDDGKNFVVADGFLRRALEIATFLVPELEGAQELACWRELQEKKRPLPTPSVARQKVTACLRLVERCCNYHSPKYGNANDVILTFNLLELCRAIVVVKECPLDDPCMVVAVQCIAALSRDSVRVEGRMQELDLLGLLRRLLRSAKDMPPDSVNACVEVVGNMASGLRTEYLSQNLALMRKQLTMVARLFPSAAARVRDAQWLITKCTSGEKRIASASSRGGSAGAQGGLAPADVEPPEAGEEQWGHVWGGHGSHEVCGLSTCGSLRLQGSSGHGSHSHLSEEEHSQLLLEMPAPHDGDELFLSKLSARDDELKQRVLAMKSKKGFSSAAPYNPPSKKAANSRSPKLRPVQQPEDEGPHASSPASKYGAYAAVSSKKPPLSPLRTVHIDEVPELLMTRPPPTLQTRKKGGSSPSMKVV